MAGRIGRIRAAAQVTLSKAITRGRAIAACTLGVIIFSGTVVAFAQSYRGLLLLATNYLHIDAPWNITWPIMVDIFLAAGELRLFIYAADGETRFWVRAWAWTLTIAGLVVSVGGNVLHDGIHATGIEMGGNAVPPLAAAAALGLGLGLVKDAVAKARAAEELARQPKVRRPQIERPLPGERPAIGDGMPKVTVLDPGRTRRKTGPKPKLETDPRLRQLVQEISKEIAKGASFTGRGIHDTYGVSRHIATQVLEIAQRKAQEVASG